MPQQLQFSPLTCILGEDASQTSCPLTGHRSIRTFFVHVHLLNLPPVQDLDCNLVGCHYMLGYLDLQWEDRVFRRPALARGVL